MNDVVWESLSIKDLLILHQYGDVAAKSKASKTIKKILNDQLSGDDVRNMRRQLMTKHGVPLNVYNKNIKNNKSITNNISILSKILKIPKPLSLGLDIHPLGGSEPSFKSINWVDAKKIENNNCYAYAINSIRSSRIHKSVPGMKSRRYKKIDQINGDYLKCEILMKEIIRDLGDKCKVLKNPYEKPPVDTYKAIMVMSPEIDFHFYRQDDDGTFSHKRGWAYNPTKLDADGKIIYDPLKCNRNYGSLNYSKVCYAFSVPIHIDFGI